MPQNKSEPVKLADLVHPPTRADARRNFERLLEAASEMFETHGINASLDEIARMAGVGNATLYRNFPTRHALLVAVCVSEVEELCMLGETLMHKPDAAAALAEWFKAFVVHVKTKRGLAAAMMTGNPGDSAVLAACQERIGYAGSSLLKRAQKSGTVRATVNFADIFTLVNAIAVATESATAEQASRLLDVIFHGIKTAKDVSPKRVRSK